MDALIFIMQTWMAGAYWKIWGAHSHCVAIVEQQKSLNGKELRSESQRKMIGWNRKGTVVGNNSILVSIIIPIFNDGDVFRECVESALQQTVSKEIICIDDGSDKETLDILDEYETKYSEIIVFHQQNSGAGIARNRGLCAARGKYISFLDADDYYNDPIALEKMVEACQQNGAKICGSLRKYFYRDTGRIVDHPLHREFCENHPQGGKIVFQDFQDSFRYQSYIFDRSFLKKNSIFFPPYRRYQDPPFFLKAMIAAGEFWVCPVELYCYQQPYPDQLEKKTIVKDLLCGVRDNIEMCENNSLWQLEKEELRRLGREYLSSIIADKSNSFDILKDIDRIVSNSQIKEMMPIFYLLSIWNTERNGSSFIAFLERNKASELYLYGLGDMGCLFYYLIRSSNIKVLKGIDRKRKTFFNIDVGADTANIANNARIIVTPLGRIGMEITDALRQKGYVNVIGLSHLIDEFSANLY